MNIVLAGNFQWSEDDLINLSDFGKNNLILLEDEKASLPVIESEVEGIICNWFFKYHPIERFKNLKFIQLLSAGYNGISSEKVQAIGIPVFTAKNVYSIPISEFVIARILSYYKKETFFQNNQRLGIWSKNRSLEEIFGKKVLIIGTGSIGNEIAKRIGAFTENVYGCNRTIRKSVLYKEIYPLVSLADIIDRFDIVIISIALAESTEHLINKTILTSMKSSALLVNISRGAVIDEKCMTEALQKYIIGGAILDVFENEPLNEDNPLWKMENVLISPHNSFVSPNNNDRMREVIFRNLINLGVINEKKQECDDRYR